MNQLLKSTSRVSFLFIGLLCLMGNVQMLSAQINNAQQIDNVAWNVSVNTFSGNLFFELSLFDIPAPGIPATAKLVYNSQANPNPAEIANAWSLDQALSYESLAGGDIRVRYPDGNTVNFSWTGVDYIAPPGSYDTLEASGPNLSLRQRNGNRFNFDNSTSKRLTSRTELNGNSSSYTYNASDQLTNIGYSVGYSIDLRWIADQLRTIYEQNGSSRRTWVLRYQNNNLVAVSGPEGRIYRFRYDAEDRLVQMINPNGQVMDLSFWPNGAVQTIEIPAVGLHKSYNFDASSRVNTVDEIVDGVPQTTEYEYDGLDRLIRRTGNCCGFDIDFEYDANNNITKAIDALGNETTYTYNLLGNLLSETDPLLNTHSYAYDLLGNLISETDKNGNTSTYIYDASRNRVQANYPGGISEYWDYSPLGLLNYRVDGNSDTVFYSYDGLGNLVSETDPLGNTTTFIYDGKGNLLSRTDANGFTTSYTYDGLDRRIKETSPAPFQDETLFFYDRMDNLIRLVDPVGNTSTYTYDALNRRTSILDAEGGSRLFSYNERNLTSIMDPNGNLTTFTYDAFNRPIEESNLDGTRFLTYDPNGNLLSDTDRRGFTTSYTYDAMDRRISETNPEMDTRTFIYDPVGNLIQEDNFRGFSTKFRYDGINRLTSIKNAAGDSAKVVYDNVGNIVTETNHRGFTTSYMYDDLGRRLLETNPLGDKPAAYTYDPVGNILTETDAEGGITTYTYDSLNRRITETDDDGAVTTSTYDGLNRLLTETHANGNTLTYTYDGLGRELTKSDNVGSISEFIYDSNDNIVFAVNGMDDTTATVYDHANRPIQIINPENDTTFFTYDANGNVVQEKNPKGGIITFEWNKLNLDTLEITTKNDSIITLYDANGNTISLEDEEGNTTTYTYDNLDRRVVETYADGSSLSYTYDKESNRSTRTDQNGDVTAYTYDAINRLTFRDYPGTNDDTFTYTKRSDLLSAQNSNAIIGYTYSNAGRILSEILNGETTQYSYNLPAGSKTITYPGGRVIVEEMDARYRLDQVKEGANIIADINYDAANRRLSTTFLNGITSSYTYDKNGQATQITHGAFWDTKYSYDANKNRVSKERLHLTINSEHYTYDGTDRLMVYENGLLVGGTIPAPTSTKTFAYDGSGNRLTYDDNGSVTTYTNNVVNEYTAINDGILVHPTHDDNGNLTFDGTQYYFYDYENHLTKVSTDAAGLIPLGEYTYDPLGRRIQKVAGGNTTTYFYDDQRVIEERTGGITTTYVFGTWVDDILSMEIGSTNYYCHTDGLGSVVSLTNSAGIVEEQYEYDAYGTPSFFNSSFVSIGLSTIGNQYLYTGRRYDSESGLYHYRARAYDPTNGRFLQRDPIGYFDSNNLYEYVAGNPINFLDPDGRRRQFGPGVNDTDVEVHKGPGKTNVSFKGELYEYPQRSKFNKGRTMEYHVTIPVWCNNNLPQFGKTTLVSNNLKGSLDSKGFLVTETDDLKVEHLGFTQKPCPTGGAKGEVKLKITHINKINAALGFGRWNFGDAALTTTKVSVKILIVVIDCCCPAK